jgi:hypothetical protein
MPLLEGSPIMQAGGCKDQAHIIKYQFALSNFYDIITVHWMNGFLTSYMGFRKLGNRVLELFI